VLQAARNYEELSAVFIIRKFHMLFAVNVLRVTTVIGLGIMFKFTILAS
jgi:hypothetical protein